MSVIGPGRISADLVRALLADQHPDLEALPVRHVARGWDNDVFRVGSDLAVRVPHREAAVPCLLAELAWLPVLAPRLPLPVPAPLRRGEPGRGYPWPWAVIPWLPGRSALHDPPTDPDEAAVTLGQLFRALHVPAPAEAPENPWRGVPLRARLDPLDRALENLAGGDQLGVPPDAIREVVAACAREVEWGRPPVWLHGDPHAHNVLVHEGRVSALVDFGDMTSGDPASDLGLLHSILGPASLRTFASAYGAPPAGPLWRRAAGWAVCLGVAVLAGPDKSLRQMGHRLLRRGMAHAQTLT